MPAPRSRPARRSIPVHRHHVVHAVFALLAAALLALLPVSATAAPAKDPLQLSIAVDDGQTTAVAGDKLAYRLTVTNLGTEPVEDLLVTQTVPAGSKLIAKDSKATESKGIVTWKVDIKPTEKATLEMSLAVLSTPDEVLRLATVACVKVSKKSPPIVCASDSNQLPAGAAAQQAESTTMAGGFLATPHLGLYIGGLAVILAALAAAVLVVRSSRQQPAVPLG